MASFAASHVPFNVMGVQTAWRNMTGNAVNQVVFRAQKEEFYPQVFDTTIGVTSNRK